MSTTLQERAARLATSTAQHSQSTVPTAAELMTRDEPETAETYYTPEQIPVHAAWNRVMQDVRAIGKGREVTSGPARFKFRGVEDVVQAFSASLRKHGVIVAPSKVTTSYTTSQSKSGGMIRECTVVVGWSVVGPMGDVLPVPVESAGEALDSSDKSTTKAQSISYRTLLLTLGAVPVNDPEPELESADIERGDPSASPQRYLAEILNPMTPRERFRQIYNELGQHRMVNTLVPHDGEQVELGALFMKVSNERWPRTRPTGAQHRDHPAGEWMDGCEGCIAESRDMDRANVKGDAA